MAYIVSTTQTATAVAASYTVTLGAHVSGDLLLVCLSQDGGGTTIAPDATATTAGWAMIGTQAASGASRQAWAYLIADSASEGNPTFTGANDDWIGTCLVIRDAHASPFGSLVDGTDFKRSDWNNVATAASNLSGDLTSAVDECLLIYSWCSDGTTQYMLCDLDDAIGVDLYASNANHIIAARQQQTAGVAPTVTMKHIVATEGGNGWILAVRNKSGGALQPDIRADYGVIRHYGVFAAQHDGTTTWQAPDQFAASINSINCTSTAPTIANNAAAIWAGAWGAETTITIASNTGDCWCGGVHDITSANLTGKVFSVQWARGQSSTSAVQGSQGVLLGFSDGTNWATYQIASVANGWNSSEPNPAHIAIGVSTPYASSGSINWGAVTKIGYLMHRITAATSTQTLQIRNAVLFGSMSVTGGGNSRSSTFGDLWKYAKGWAGYRYVDRQGDAQILAKSTVQIGDGTNKTYFDGSAQSFEFPQAFSATANDNWQMRWNANASAVGLSVKASASDTIKLAAGVAATDTLQNLTIDASSSTSATYDFGQSFVGWSPTWKTGIACVNATFSGCDPVNFKGTTVTNVIIKNTLAGAGEAAVIFDESGATVTSTTIDGTGADYAIELGTAVTAITLASCTITAGSTDKIHVLKTTGTVTITISGTTSLVAGDVTSEGATVVISAPELYQSVTISGLTAGSRVQIYDYGVADTELYNDVVAGTSVTWTDTVPADSQRDIRVRIAYVDGTDAKEFIEANIGSCGITEGTEDVSYLANQVDDSVYITNGIDGSAVTGVTFTDTTVDVINIDLTLPVDIQDIYAAWVYYAFTETGIASSIDYIEAVDIANYILSNLVIKNTTSPSVPLKLVGGYFWDATTGDPMDCIDTTGGTIFLAPPHVVPKIVSTSSSVVEGTPATVAAAVLSAAQSTPIYADIRKVNNYTVDGDGQTGSEWGPT